MLSIGEFSTASRLSIKALRIYHDEGLLVPEHIDPHTGYRHYGEKSFERARIIAGLKEIGFSLAEIRGIVEHCSEDDDLTVFFTKRLTLLEQEIEQKQQSRAVIKRLLETERRSTAMKQKNDITEKEVNARTVCTIRYKGRYDGCGEYYGRLFKAAGRYACSAPFMINHDNEYREDNADLEVGFEVRKPVQSGDIQSRILNAGRAVTVIHYGPYETIGDSYKRLFDYVQEKGYTQKAPCMEYYIKGPGMFFPRSPKKYITEIMIFI